MPVIDSRKVRAFAHCTRPLCDHVDVEVDAHRDDIGQTYVENGGDIPGVERSFVSLRFADEADATCVCGAPRALAEEGRPSYQPISGHDPMGLVSGMAPLGTVTNSPEDERVAALEAQLRVQGEQLARLLEAQGGGD